MDYVNYAKDWVSPSVQGTSFVTPALSVSHSTVAIGDLQDGLVANFHDRMEEGHHISLLVIKERRIVQVAIRESGGGR
jgi:hypothetical protein